MKRILMAAVAFLLSASFGQAAVQGEEVAYAADGVTLKGYLAYDDAGQGKRPGILVVHEWWGHNDYARKRARMLAELGYTALAVDMYGDGRQAAHPDDAGKFAGEVSQNMPVARARFLAAHSFTNPDADRFAKEFGLGAGYNAAADQKSRADMQSFFKKFFIGLSSSRQRSDGAKNLASEERLASTGYA